MKLKAEIWLIFILIFALTLRLIFFTGINSSDDFLYVNFAHGIITGKINITGCVSDNLRFLFTIPIAFFFWLIGINNYTAGLWTLICSLGMIVISYKIGETSFNKRVGLLSAFLLSFYPLNVIYGTRVAPDVPTVFFMGMSVYLFLKGLKTKGKTSGISYLCSGIAAGLSYLVKALGLLIFVFYGVYILFDVLKKRKIIWSYCLVFLGFLLIFLSESLFYYFVTGDFLFRVDKLVGTYSVTKDYMGKGIRPIDVLTFYPPAMLNLINYYGYSPNTKIFGFFFYFVLIASIYLLIKREKRSYFFILWLLSLFLYLQVGTRSLTQYLLFGKEIRFLSIISIPSVILMSVFLTYNKKIVKILLPVSILFLLSTSIYYIYFLANHLNYGLGECGCMNMNDIKEISMFVKNHWGKPVYLDPYVYHPIRFYLEYKTDNLLRFTNSVQNVNEIKDAYVILNTSTNEQIPEFMQTIPPNWKLVRVITSPIVYLKRNYNPVIYYAPL